MTANSIQDSAGIIKLSGTKTSKIDLKSMADKNIPLEVFFNSIIAEKSEQTMQYSTIDIKNKFTLFTEHWSPKIIAQMNDYHFKLTKIQGDFVWHKHDETDEVFIVIEGEMGIEFPDDKVVLRSGEMMVVPKGVEHKPYAAEECRIMVIEPAGTINTGDSGGDMTKDELEWI